MSAFDEVLRLLSIAVLRFSLCKNLYKMRSYEAIVAITQKQMEKLFAVKPAAISEHINNNLSSGELDETSVGFSDKSSGGRKHRIYNPDVILSVGCRVNSECGIAFRKWASANARNTGR